MLQITVKHKHIVLVTFDYDLALTSDSSQVPVLDSAATRRKRQLIGMS